MKALGIDIGSTSIKGAVLDLDADRIGKIATRPFPAAISGLPVGWFEVTPLEVDTATRQVIGELRQEEPSPAAILFSGQMGGVVLVDEQGEALTNYLSWRDQRTNEFSSEFGKSYLEEIRSRWGGKTLASLGNELQAGSSPALLFWLSVNQQLPDRGVPLSIADFVIGQLTGGDRIMHGSQCIGQLDLATKGFHQAAYAKLGLSEINLPRLSDECMSREVSLSSGATKIFGAYGDQQCALLGAGLKRGELSINISTGSQVSMRVEQFTPGPYQTRMFFDGDYLNTITHLPAGRSLNVLVDLLTELARAEGITLRDPWGELIRRATAVEQTDLTTSLSYFAGPLGSSGAIQGITTENLTVGNLFHAAFRQMADTYTEMAKRLDREQKATAVVISGGLTKAAPILRRMIEERFAIPIREASEEETLLGLLQLARTALKTQ